ncbi:hypothetical protein uan_042 [Pseudomonas phage UAntarctica]|nr:hypothetical protein uan_042 [Pseudomonas phage UAntarctica]
MSSKHMIHLANSIQESGVTYNRNADLPLPNLYFVSVFPLSGHAYHTYFAADFTQGAMQKTINWCVDRHGFRPYRSNSTIKVRRMLLGDIIENPNAYCQALQHAKENCEADILTALRKLPGIIAGMVGVPLPALDTKAADVLWDRLSAEVAAITTRTLRA